VIAGSRYILDHHNQTNNDIIVVWTSTPISEEPWPVHTARERARPPVVSWAQAQPMDYARELDFVAEIARRLRLLGSRFTLRLYGVNTEWERAQLTSKFGTDCVLELSPTLPYDRFLTSLREVSVGLCPLMTDSPFSRGKSFGKTLAYLTSGVPVVASDAADHNEFFQAGAGVLSNEPDVWVEAVSGLLAKPLDRDRMADNAAKLLRQHLSLEVAAARTDQFLRKILAKSNQRFDD
jgi:glycosyltransferase involved in cell wall biosynthesis